MHQWTVCHPLYRSLTASLSYPALQLEYLKSCFFIGFQSRIVFIGLSENLILYQAFTFTESQDLTECAIDHRN